MRPSRILAVIGLTALALVPALSASPAVAGTPPLIERVDIDEQFVAVHISAACGFTVTGTGEGHVTFRTYDRETGVISGATVRITIRLSGPGGEYTYLNVGADLLRVTSDGDAILMVTGQAPFIFTGALKIDLVTEEVTLEPQHSTQDELARACAALAG